MRHTHRWLAAALTLCMVLSLCPLSALAEPGAQAVTVPMVMQEDSLQLQREAVQPDLIYAWAGEDTLACNDQISFSADLSDKQQGSFDVPLSLSLRDASGRTVEGARSDTVTGSFSGYDKSVSIRGVVFTAPTAFAPGDYTILAVIDGQEYQADHRFRALSPQESILISDLSCREVSAASPFFDAVLSVQGQLRLPEDLSSLTITLSDKATHQVVAESDTSIQKNYRQYGPNSWNVTCRMVIRDGTSLSPGTAYDLELHCTGSRTLYLDLRSHTVTPEKAAPAIERVECISASPAKLRLWVRSPGSQLHAVISDWNGQLFDGTVKPGAANADGLSPADIPLERNGAACAMKELAGSLSLELIESNCRVSQYTYQNPYCSWNETSCTVSPVIFPSSLTQAELTLRFRDGQPNWLPSGNVLTLCSGDGSTVYGTCQDPVLTRDGELFIIRGTMDCTLPSEDNPTLLLNGQELPGAPYLRITDQPEWYSSQQTFFDDSSNTFYGFMDAMLFSITGMVNFSDHVRILFKDAQGSIAAQSPAYSLTPNRSGAADLHAAVPASAYASLTDGAYYTIWVQNCRTGAAKKLYSEDGQGLLFDGKPGKPFTTRELLGSVSSQPAGQTFLPIYIHALDQHRNLSRADLLSAVENAVLRPADSTGGSELHITDALLKDGRCLFLLDHTLAAGSYAIEQSGVTLCTFNVWAPSGPSAYPRIIRASASSCCIEASSVPSEGLTGQVYLGYQAKTAQFPLTAGEEDLQDHDRYLYFTPQDLAGLPSGVYRLVIRADGAILGEVQLDILDQKRPTLLVMDQDEQWDDAKDPVLHTRTISVQAQDPGEYIYFRAGLSREALDQTDFVPVERHGIQASFFFTVPDSVPSGPITILVDLSINGETTASTVTLERFLWADGEEYPLFVPDSVTGDLHAENNAFVFTASTTLPACIWAKFYDAEGRSAMKRLTFDQTVTDDRGQTLYQHSLRLSASERITSDIDGTALPLLSVCRAAFFAADLNGSSPGDDPGYSSMVRSAVVSRDIRLLTPPAASSIRLFLDGQDVTGKTVDLPRPTSSLDRQLTAQVLDQYGQPLAYQYITRWKNDAGLPGITSSNNTGYRLTITPAAKDVITVTAEQDVYLEEEYGASDVQLMGGGQYAYTLEGSMTFVLDDGGPSFPTNGSAGAPLIAQRMDPDTRLTWICRDSALDHFVIQWQKPGDTAGAIAAQTMTLSASACRTGYADTYSCTIPDWIDRGTFTVTAYDRPGNHASLSVNNRVETGSAAGAVNGPDVWTIPAAGKTSYTLTTPEAGSGSRVVWSVRRWTSLSTPPAAETRLQGNVLTIGADETAVRLDVKGLVTTASGRTAEVHLTLDLLNAEKTIQCQKPQLPAPGQPAPEQISTTVTLAQPLDIPVRVIMTGYDAQGRMIVRTGSAEIKPGDPSADVSIGYAEGLTDVRVFFQNALTGAPIRSAVTSGS